MINKKHLVLASTLLAVVACGFNKKKNNQTDNNTPSGKAPLQLTSESLTLGETHTVTANLANHPKLSAPFQFQTDTALVLRLSSSSLDVDGCSEEAPAPTFTWLNDGGSESQQLTAEEQIIAEANQGYTMILGFDNLTQCHQVEITFRIDGTPQASEERRSPSPSLSDVDFDHHVLIREFTANEKGALFIIKPDIDDPLTITKVQGPRFLGNAQVSIIDESTVTTIFSTAATSIPNSRRQQLLNDYRGAAAIYFGGYMDPLCSEQDLELIVTATLREVVLTSTFKFAARAAAQGDCQFLRLGMLTAY